jgi:hypothetical protein
VWPLDGVLTDGTISYSAWQVMFFELCHGILSLLAALSVSLAVLFLTSITYPSGYSMFDIRSLSRSLGPTRWSRVVICMVLLSLSAGLLAHTLEDLFFAWF